MSLELENLSACLILNSGKSLDLGKLKRNNSYEFCRSLTAQLIQFIDDLKSNSYMSFGDFEKDKLYVLKKLGFSSDEFELYMKLLSELNFNLF